MEHDKLSQALNFRLHRPATKCAIYKTLQIEYNYTMKTKQKLQDFVDSVVIPAMENNKTKWDRSINLENWLNTDGEELKEFFKHEFAKSLNKEFGDKVQINYPNDAISRFIALYGFEEFLDKLPNTLKRFDFEKTNRGGYGRQDQEKTPSVSLPNKIFNFPGLEVLHVEGILDSLPEDIERLQKLQFISIPNNPNLKTLPASISKLPNLESWINIIEKQKSLRKNIEIGIVGKYIELKDAYKSISEAIIHAGVMLIYDKAHPILVKDKLNAFLDSKERIMDEE